MEKILFESKVKCQEIKGAKYLHLDEKGITIKKKKYIFFGELLDLKRYLIKDIKYKNGRTLVRVIERKVDIIFETSSINLTFSDSEDAKKFYDKVIELKKNDTFINRSKYNIQNMTEEDIKKGLKKIVKTIGVVSILVHGLKSVVSDGKNIFEEGKEIIKSIAKKK